MHHQTAVENDTVVTIHYTLTSPEGEVIDTSAGGEPLVYLHGAGNIVPGLERQLSGHGVGEHVHAVVTPVEGYGERTGPAPQPVPRSRFPKDTALAAGMQVVAEGPDGTAFALWIVDVGDEEVLLDHNHPLAGVELHFDVDITEVRAATAEELAHGHPHGGDDLYD